MAQYKVPQKIDLEDKIVGPLTLIQFFQLAVGGLVLYLFLQLFDTELFLAAGIPVTIATLAIAFVRINDQPLTHFIAAGWKYWKTPKEQVWGKKAELEGAQVTITEKTKPEEIKTATKQVSQSELEKLSAILDTYGKPAGEPKTEDQKPKIGGEARGA